MTVKSLTAIDGGSGDIEEPDWDYVIADQCSPEWVSNKPWREFAHREWLRITGVLREAGTLGAENRHQIQRLITAYVRYDMATRKAFQTSMVILSPRGFPVSNMWQSEMRQADMDATTCENELGIPPKRRRGVDKAKKKPETRRASDAYLSSAVRKPS